MAQFPMDMGRTQGKGNAIAKTVDAEGRVRYDALARVGHAKDKVRLNVAIIAMISVFLCCKDLTLHVGLCRITKYLNI